MQNMNENNMNSYKIINYTLIFLKNNSKILLGLKKRGLGVGKYNGFGGKLKPDETLTDCVLRELKEESNLSTKNIKHLGVCLYKVLHDKRLDLVHVYTSNQFSGVPAESEEMLPKWFDISSIPYGNMWPDAKLWHPFMLTDKNFLTYVTYQDEKTISETTIKEYDNISSVLKKVDFLKNKILKE